MTDFDSMNGHEAQSNGAPRPRLVPLPGVTKFKLEELVEAPRNDGLTLSEKALHGLVGDVVRTIEPHTESDPVAILVQLLVNFGNQIGRAPYYPVESTQHHTNLFAVLVGASSKARKGTAANRVRAVFQHVDQTWTKNRIKSGLSSGEGLIDQVRDPVEKWNIKDHVLEVIDAGVEDKRLLVIEGEFARILGVMERPGNILSSLIRNAWDGETLENLTVTSHRKATDPHISIVGHITQRELRGRLTGTDAANGFANRFLFFCVKRSKSLPFGGSLDPLDIGALGERVREAAEFAKTVGRVGMTPAARNLWAHIYEQLSAEQDGLLGAVTARAEAQTVRVATVYALMDRRMEIDVAHLEAALAVWEYSEASAVRIFGDSLGDPVADDILTALRQAGTAGMTRTSVRDLFGRNQGSDRIGMALAKLASKGLAIMENRKTGGRPVETWFATRKAR
jgi:hypothetical protein